MTSSAHVATSSFDLWKIPSKGLFVDVSIERHFVSILYRWSVRTFLSVFFLETARRFVGCLKGALYACPFRQGSTFKSVLRPWRAKASGVYLCALIPLWHTSYFTGLRLKGFSRRQCAHSFGLFASVQVATIVQRFADMGWDPCRCSEVKVFPPKKIFYALARCARLANSRWKIPALIDDAHCAWRRLVRLKLPARKHLYFQVLLRLKAR